MPNGVDTRRIMSNKIKVLIADDHAIVRMGLASLLADDPPLPDLSPRQIEILESIARGLTKIAQRKRLLKT